jgi:hypothetical protein
VDADLHATKDPEPVLQPDQGSAIEAEQIVHQITKITLAQRPRESVCDSKRAAVAGHSHGRGERDERVVGLCRQDPAILVWILLGPDRDRRDEQRENAQQQN